MSELRVGGPEDDDERTRAASQFCLFYRDYVEGLLERIRLGRRKFPRLLVRAILPVLLIWLPLLLGRRRSGAQLAHEASSGPETRPPRHGNARDAAGIAETSGHLHPYGVNAIPSETSNWS